MKLSLKLDNATDFLKYLLIISFYYMAYRYPLQISDSDTSPTYIDTPFSLQVLKYLLFFLLCGVFFVKSLLKKRGFRVPGNRLFDFLFFSFIFLVPILYDVLTTGIEFFETGLFFGALLLFFLSSDREVDVSRAERWISVFLVLSILVELIQLALFFGVGRLPALAYSNSISVRFGSIWDDPNGFAFMLTFLIPFVLAKRINLLTKAALFVVLSIMMLLTQSLTGIFAFAVALIVGVFTLGLLLKDSTYWKQGLFLLLSYVFTAILVFSVVMNLEIVKEFLLLKSGSIEDHIELMGVIHQASALNYLGLGPKGVVSETGYINILYNLGIVYFLAYLVMLGYTLFRLVRAIRDNQGRRGVEVYYGAFFFVLSFAIGMGNLPLDGVFPLNLILVVCLLFTYGRLAPSEPGLR